ncbi:methyltransferase domain-containing protein [Shewanella violacea]|uniref:Biotin synthesis protein BioC n=1 Tax=Shewanella violacea (strain JCM 10179 / CIP 106290 / LMG 19151 / DSS12) TaxID=637905 RepID=D4ZLX9_SHEVD|nr:methyltransferase domain-containing protein [Shewanella violacea]BAJ02678.1 biotin synthesis protein BioC [Shewanella violacea DSS12]
MNKRVAQSINDKTVAQRFSAAAKHYHEHDRVQKLSSMQIFDTMNPSGVLLDIGAGPGTDFSQFSSVKQVIALDIAQGMLEQVKLDFPTYQTVCANAESIPLPENSIDSAYSNLALQWCGSLSTSFNETARVLKAEGEYHLALVAQDSLPELTELGFRVNAFRSMEEILSHFDRDKWQIISFETRAISVYFADLKSLLYSIKGVGASIHGNGDDNDSAKDKPSQGIRGRGDWTKLLAAAELSRTAQGLPLTYQIALISAKRLSNQ